jgi:hypothetical protein
MASLGEMGWRKQELIRNPCDGDEDKNVNVNTFLEVNCVKKAKV